MKENIFSRALKLKGEVSQIDITLEELAEMMQALIKYKRCNDEYEKVKIVENIAEEIADVQIMLNQMKENFQFEKLVEEYYDRKMTRLGKRLSALEKGE